MNFLKNFLYDKFSQEFSLVALVNQSPNQIPKPLVFILKELVEMNQKEGKVGVEKKDKIGVEVQINIEDYADLNSAKDVSVIVPPTITVKQLFQKLAKKVL